MTIEYYFKNVYGKEFMYIKDEKIAKILSKLTGMKTMSPVTVEALESLGHRFVQVLPQ